ncbi:type II toxin-antitoxin system VapC family toxin [Thiohalorhabdus sp.]|uniref:type II toxin-antitoxin system VapC family toxin n=1 Tax=Thiohalorhabdus sp. TaxID=3094134 RepID=UPI002FC32A88
MFALDTNILIYFFKGEGRVAERLLAQPPTRIAIPTLVVYELEVGIAKSTSPERRVEQLGELVDTVTLLPFHREAASEAAAIRAELEAIGRPIGPLDTLIAGTAAAHDATLVTRNTAEFARIDRLSVEDWYG